jgi:hypothetical protein
MFEEGLGKGRERSGPSKALDRGDLTALVLHGESEAGIDPLAVDQDCAGATRPLIAAFLRPEKVQMLAQEIEERRSHVHPAPLRVD